MNEWGIAAASAFWLGILTSISPCPLATNIAAISYVGRKVDRPSSVVVSGLLYTGGRALTYTLLGVVMVSSLLSIPTLSHVLQKYMNILLGPILLLVGLVLLNIITLPFSTQGGLSRSMQNKTESMGVWGAGVLGILFALSFCPTSAALFFGSLLPLALKQNSGIVLPSLYGIATGLPVLVFAGLLATGANRLAKSYNKIVVFEKWARRVTGIVFVFVGAYYSAIPIISAMW